MSFIHLTFFISCFGVHRREDIAFFLITLSATVAHKLSAKAKKKSSRQKKEKLAAEVKINSTAEVKTHGGSKGFLKLQRIYEITCNKYLCHMSKLTIKRIVSLDVLTS